MKSAELPVVSVLIPEALSDPRRKSYYLESWTKAQLPPGLPFEVVMAMKNGYESYSNELRQFLRPQDQLILGDFSSEMACYQAAAEAAIGKYLLITENHAIAETDCLEKLISFVQSETHRAASLRSKFQNFTHLDRQEEGLYEDYLTGKWLKSGEWDRVRLRGFVIEKELYFELGGLPEDYGLFSEEYFAYRLSHAGVPVGYVEDAAVRHVNVGTFSGLRHDIEDFAHGECVFRDIEYEKSQLNYFGEPEIWRQRAVSIPGMRRRLEKSCFAIGRNSLTESHFALAASAFLRAGSHGVLSRIPKKMWSQRAEFRIQWLRFCTCIFQKSKYGRKAFESMWQAIRDATRLRYFEERPEPEGYELPETFHFSEADPPQLLGFHQRESYDGRTFRWTEPLASVRLRLRPEAHQVTIDTNQIRGADCDFPFGIVFNEKSISKFERKNGKLSFRLEKGWFVEGEQLLILFSQPLRRSKEESRKLGFPVFDLQCSPVQKHFQSKEKVVIPIG